MYHTINNQLEKVRGDRGDGADTYVEETIVQSETKFKVVVVVEATDGYYQDLETQLLTQSESKTETVNPEDIGNIVAKSIGDAIGDAVDDGTLQDNESNAPVQPQMFGSE